MESPRKPKEIIHKISEKKEPIQNIKEEKILNFLNSIKTHQQLTIAVSKDNVIDETMAKNILAARTRLGKFTSLNQVSMTTSMDPKKFQALIESLNARF